MVALVLATDTVTYTILYCVVIPECNINMITRVPHAGLHPSLHMIQLRFVDKS